MAVVIYRTVAITPHASNNIGTTCLGIVASGAGTATLVMEDDSLLLVTLAVNVPLIGISFKRVNAVGTAATGIVGLIGAHL